MFSKASALVAGALALVACSNETDVTTTQSKPTSTSYDVMFPATAVATTTDTLQVFVFDATNASTDGTDCLTLLTKRSSGGELPGGALRIVATDATSPCDLLTGGKGQIPVSYGARSFLLVGQRSGQDYFVGCATKTVSSADAPVAIQLSPANATVAVPATTCTTLTDRCAKTCS